MAHVARLAAAALRPGGQLLLLHLQGGKLDGVPGISKFFAPAGGGAVFIPSLEQL